MKLNEKAQIEATVLLIDNLAALSAIMPRHQLTNSSLIYAINKLLN